MWVKCVMRIPSIIDSGCTTFGNIRTKTGIPFKCANGQLIVVSDVGDLDKPTNVLLASQLKLAFLDRKLLPLIALKRVMTSITTR